MGVGSVLASNFQAELLNVKINYVMPNIDPSLHHRLLKTKAALLAVSFTLAGILLMMLNAWLAPLRLGDWQWLHAVPLGELGGTLFGAGCCRRSSSSPFGGTKSAR